MHTLFILWYIFLIISGGHALCLRGTREMISCNEKVPPLSAGPSNRGLLIHEIYNSPAPHHLQSGVKSQKPLQAYDDNVHNANKASTGTINMLSTAACIVPINFTLSHALCPTGRETLRMIDELVAWMLVSHAAGMIDANETIQETVKLDGKRTEYRATLSLTMSEYMEVGPFLELVKLVKRTTEVLFVEIGNRGVGTLVESGVFENVEFEVFWTWYEFLDGVARRCEEDDNDALVYPL